MKCFAIMLLSVSFLLGFASCSEDARVQKELEKYAEGQNAIYPIRIDDMTNLNSCEAFPNKTLRYNYSFMMNKASVDSTAAKSALRETLLSLLKVDPGTTYLRNNGVVFQYRYIDNAGEYAFQLELTPEDYKNK